MADRYLTPPQVAERFGCKADKVLGWIKRGELRAVNLGDKTRPRWKIRPADLEAFEERRSNLVTIAPRKPRQRRKPDDSVIEFYT